MNILIRSGNFEVRSITEDDMAAVLEVKGNSHRGAN